MYAHAFAIEACKWGDTFDGSQREDIDEMHAKLRNCESATSGGIMKMRSVDPL
jgi:hypothetical protein